MNVEPTRAGGNRSQVGKTGETVGWRYHLPGIAAALLFTLVLVGPRWYLLTTDPPEGERIQVNVYGASGIGLDEAYYAALVRDAYDGNVPIRDPFFEDASETAVQTGSLWDVVVGSSGRILGDQDVALAIAISLAAIATFLLFYILCWRITGSRWAAVGTIAITMLATYVIHRSPGFLALRHWEILGPLVKLDPLREMHIWTRFLAPAMPLPFLFGAILVLPGAVLEGRRWHLVGAALLLAVLMYTYLFSWLSLAIALAGWAVWLFVTNDRQSALRIIVIGAAASFLALPELALVIRNSLELNDDAQTRVGAFGGIGLHTEWLRPVFQRLLLGLPFGLLALHAARERKENILYIALYIAPLLPAMISDFLPQTDHFLFQAWPIFAIPMLVAGGIEGYRLLPGPGRTVVAGAFAVLAVVGALHFATMQVRAVRQVEATYAVPADEYAAFQWIEDNLSENDTVVTPSWITNQQVAVLTEASTYLADGFLTRILNEEIVDRYLRVSAAYGIDEDVVFYRIDPVRDVPVSKKDVPDDELETYFEDAMVYYLFNEGIRRPAKLTEPVPAWRESYERLLSSEEPLAEYEADYLFCGHRERFWTALDPAPGTWVTEAFRDGDAVIYRVETPETPGAVEFEGC